MMIWLVILLIIAFVLFQIKKNSSNIKSKKDVLFIQPEIDLSPISSFPDRNQSISFHKATLLKSFNSGDLKQANLSFAKLIESYRQQNINNNGDLEIELLAIRNLYEVFRTKFHMDYPTEYLPPKKRKESKDVTNTIVQIQKRNNFMTIGNYEYHGKFAESPNKRFTISWSDFDPNSGVGGFRESGKGTFVFLDGDIIKFKGKLDRPNDGCVGNNGNFIISDLGFGEGLKGTIYAFNSDGNEVLKKKYKANIFNSAISPDGDYAVCQTCNSENNDSNLISFFDILNGEMAWSMKNEFFWADSYIFNLQEKTILLQSRDYGDFSLGFDGTILDKKKLEILKDKRTTPTELFLTAKDLLQIYLVAADSEKYELKIKIISLTERIFEKSQGKFPYEESMGQRIRGEICESEGKIGEAIDFYETAIKINSKVGVKKRLNLLKKKIAENA